jgi:hypothetical protein
MSVAETARKSFGQLVNSGRKALECTGTLVLIAVASLNYYKVPQLEYMTKTICKLIFE